MADTAPKQAKSWDDIQIWMAEMDKQYAKMPAPPRPNDNWSEKVNNFHRCLEGMREQMRSEVEQEDNRRQRAEEMADG